MDEKLIPTASRWNGPGARASLVACVVFAIGAGTIPKLVSMRSLIHFNEMGAPDGPSPMAPWYFVAFSDATYGFTLQSMKGRVRLPMSAFVVDGDTTHGEVSQHVSILKQVGGTTFLETVREGGASTITSRYRLDGQTVAPISTQILSPADVTIGFIAASLIAVGVRLLLVRIGKQGLV